VTSCSVTQFQARFASHWRSYPSESPQPFDLPDDGFPYDGMWVLDVVEKHVTLVIAHKTDIRFFTCPDGLIHYWENSKMTAAFNKKPNSKMLCKGINWIEPSIRDTSNKPNPQISKTGQ